MLDSAQAWSAQHNVVGQHMTINAGSVVDMMGVVTQGRSDSSQWVTSFQVQVSVDGSTFTAVDSGATFQGNSDRNTRGNALFSTPAQAQSHSQSVCNLCSVRSCPRCLPASQIVWCRVCRFVPVWWMDFT